MPNGQNLFILEDHLDAELERSELYLDLLLRIALVVGFERTKNSLRFNFLEIHLLPLEDLEVLLLGRHGEEDGLALVTNARSSANLKRGGTVKRRGGRSEHTRWT